MAKFLNALVKHKWWTGIGIVACIGIVVFITTSKTQAQTRYVLTNVKKDTVVTSVTGSGQITALNQIDLKPQASGVVVDVRVKNGEEVHVGQLIAMIDPKNAVLAINQAKASVASAEASFQKLMAGPSDPDVQASRVSVASAEASLENAKRSLEDTKKQQELNVSNAYHTLLNSGLMNSGVSTVGFSANPNPGNLSSLQPSISGTYFGDTQGDYVIHLYDAGQLHFLISGLETAEGAVNTSSPVPLGSKGLYIQFPTGALYANDSWTISIPNTRASNYLGNYNSYQSTLQSQSQSVHNAEAAVRTAEISLQQAQAALALKVAAARPEDVASANAQLSMARTQLQSAEFAYQNNLITAPFDGKIAQLNVQRGDQLSAGTAAATLITKQLFAQIPLNEVDAAKVKVGQKATLTFDAIDGLSVVGTVAEIQTLGVVTQGVVNYTIKIGFDTQDERIKPGMSVRAAIVTDVKQDVLTLPNAAIKSQGGQAYVETLNPSSVVSVANSAEVTSAMPVTRRMVETGLANNEITEIVNGLQEGDAVISQTISATAKTATPQNGSLRIPGLTGGGGGFGGAGGGARGGVGR